MQEVFRGLSETVRRGNFRCDCDEHLGRILCARTAERLADEIRRHGRWKRDAACERNALAAASDGENCAYPEPIDSHPTPERLAEARDQLRAFVDRLPLRAQLIVWFRLDGYTLPEMADLLQCSLRTIQGLWEGICRQARAEAKKEEMDGWMRHSIDSH